MATIAARMQQRRRTNTQWAAENPTLAIGEIGMETGGQATPLMKMGDGATAWNSLPYLHFSQLQRFSATAAEKTGTATKSSTSDWGGILLANASTGGMSWVQSYDAFWVAAQLSWGYIPITGGSNVRWTASITRVNALGFGDLVTDAPQTTVSLTQAMGTTNQIEHVFNQPSTFNLHNSDAVLGEVVNIEIQRIGGDGADTSTADCLLTNFSIQWLS